MSSKLYLALLLIIIPRSNTAASILDVKLSRQSASDGAALKLEKRDTANCNPDKAAAGKLGV
jgi:hypothetical protein